MASNVESAFIKHIQNQVRLLQHLSFLRKPESMQLIYHEDGKEQAMTAHVCIIPRTHYDQNLRLVDADEWEKLLKLLEASTP